MAPLASFRARIKGRVQGVGFRYFAQAQAQRLGLRGFARNLPDGSVEVVAVGQREALELFARELEEGPASARVAQCQILWLENAEAFADFTIRL
jgi:acylphosphatase